MCNFLDWITSERHRALEGPRQAHRPVQESPPQLAKSLLPWLQEWAVLHMWMALITSPLGGAANWLTVGVIFLPGTFQCPESTHPTNTRITLSTVPEVLQKVPLEPHTEHLMQNGTPHEDTHTHAPQHLDPRGTKSGRPDTNNSSRALPHEIPVRHFVFSPSLKNCGKIHRTENLNHFQVSSAVVLNTFPLPVHLSLSPISRTLLILQN